MGPVNYEVLEIKRPVEAVAIPSGDKTTLPKGEKVILTQALGGSFTVKNGYGALLRIAGKDADALGKEPPKMPENVEGLRASRETVLEALKNCYDPEIPVNIVDLGLIYECEVHDLPESGSHVNIVMTLTAPGCGMADVLAEDVRAQALQVPGVKSAEVKVTFDPPWDQSRMTEAARLQLGLL